MIVQICNICDIMQVPEKINSLKFVTEFYKSPRIKVNETCMDDEHLICFSCELTELYDQMLFMVFRCWSVTGIILVVSSGDNKVRYVYF